MQSQSLGRSTLVALLASFVVCGQAGTRAQGGLVVSVAVDLAATVGARSVASGLNDVGTVVGTRSPYGIPIAFIWAGGETATDIGGGTALAVNNHNDVVGHTSWGGVVPYARVWSGGTIQDVAYGIAYDVNDQMAVVGFHYPPNTIYHAFRWTSTNGLEDVESLTGSALPWSYFTPTSEARSIRNDGLMTGWRGGRAVLWLKTGELSELGDGVVNAINDDNLAAGSGAVSEQGRPVVWREGAVTELASSPGEALGVNASGYVVGWYKSGGFRHAFVWHKQYGFRDLGPGEARAVNDAGRVVGYVQTAPETRAIVWQIVLPVTDALRGFESTTIRLLAGAGGRDADAVLRDLRQARTAAAKGHNAIARRRVSDALASIADLQRTGTLSAVAAQALLAFGESVIAALV